MKILNKNNKIGILSPSGRVCREDVSFALETLQSWGFEPIFGKNCFHSYGCFSDTPENRKSDLQAMLDSSEIRTIFCTRGGYGLAQIINDLNFDLFKKNPKTVAEHSYTSEKKFKNCSVMVH